MQQLNLPKTHSLINLINGETTEILSDLLLPSTVQHSQPTLPETPTTSLQMIDDLDELVTPRNTLPHLLTL